MLVDVAIEVMIRAAQRTGAKVLYSDEDKIDKAGYLLEPNLKCDWNYRYILGCNYVCHLLVAQTDLVRAVGPLRTKYNGAQDHDFVLRLSEQLDHGTDPSRQRDPVSLAQDPQFNGVRRLAQIVCDRCRSPCRAGPPRPHWPKGGGERDTRRDDLSGQAEAGSATQCQHHHPVQGSSGDVQALRRANPIYHRLQEFRDHPRR